jgi:hypothetical protein
MNPWWLPLVGLLAAGWTIAVLLDRYLLRRWQRRNLPHIETRPGTADMAAFEHALTLPCPTEEDR